MLAELFSARVPRYTSYPTAPHFHGGVNAEVHRGWLAELPKAAALSLYLHIPFCDTLCWFCGCHTTVVNRYSPVAGYLDLLLMEIETVAAIGPGRKVKHIHWGGGSPTILSPSDVRRLAGELGSRFTIAPDAEFAVEIDPRGLADEMVAALAEAGVNRASIGVQDFDEKVQRAINRIQPFAETRAAAEKLRAAGISALNLDLIYGLPHQTTAHVARTIELSLQLEPQRFAVFGYAHLPQFKRHMRLIDAAALPGAEERLAEFELAHELLGAHGYVAIGLDHFALPEDSLALAQRSGRLMRNFQGYTADDAPALIGLGASAISSLPQGYAQNRTEVSEYRKAIQAGELATMRGFALNDEDRLRRAIIERLMCDLEVDLDAVAVPFGKSAADFEAELAALAPYREQGLVTIAGSKLVLPPSARASVRLVASVFDRYLGKGGAVHAVAV